MVDIVSKCIIRTRSSVQLIGFNCPVEMGARNDWMALTKGEEILFAISERFYHPEERV